MNSKGNALLSDVSLEQLPLLEIFSRDIKLNDSLRYKIDSILDQRLRNEMVISKWLNDGISNPNMEISESDVKLIELHNRSKDSIGDLVKIKQLLGGLPTESKSVVHMIDTNAVLDAVRKVRRERVSAVDDVLPFRFGDGKKEGEE